MFLEYKEAVVGIIAILSLLSLFGTIVLNMTRNNSITAWLFPDGTTKTEKLIIAISLFVFFLCFIIPLPDWC